MDYPQDKVEQLRAALRDLLWEFKKTIPRGTSYPKLVEDCDNLLWGGPFGREGEGFTYPIAVDYPQGQSKRDRFTEIGDALFKERSADRKPVKGNNEKVFPARGLRRDWTPSA